MVRFIHKRRRNILGGGEAKGGLKFLCCNKLEGRNQVNQGLNSDMGDGGIKNGQKNSDVFYGQPLTVFWLKFYEFESNFLLIYDT